MVPPFHVRFILSWPLGPLLVTPSRQWFCHRVLEFLPFVLVAWYVFFLFICFVVYYALPFYVYFFDTWSLIFLPLALAIWCHPLVHGAPIQLFAIGASHHSSCLITILVTRLAFGGCLFLTCVMHVFHVLGTTPHHLSPHHHSCCLGALWSLPPPSCAM